MRSNPIDDRVRGARSWFLIATSSLEQHGYEDAPDTGSDARAAGPFRVSATNELIKDTFDFKRSRSISAHRPTAVPAFTDRALRRPHPLTAPAGGTWSGVAAPP